MRGLMRTQSRGGHRNNQSARSISIITMVLHRIFPTFVYKARLALPNEVRQEAIYRILSITKASNLDNINRITADNAPQTLHLDDKLRKVLRIIGLEIRRLLFEKLFFSKHVTSFAIGRCWPVVVRGPDGGGQIHFHNGAVFSGVLYLQMPVGSGGIEFARPFKSPSDFIYKSRFRDVTKLNESFKVRSNDLLIFSSTLWHRALPTSAVSQKPRVAMAFDIYAMSDIRDVSAGMPQTQFLKSVQSL